MLSRRWLKRIVSEEWHNIFLLVLLAVSLGINVVLFRELRASSRETGVVSKGDRLDPFTVRDMDGTLRNLRFDDVSTPTLIYVITPECVWCALNWRAFNALANQSQSRFRVVSLSLTGKNLSAYRVRYNVRSTMLHSPEATAVAKYGFSITPQTLLISPSGVILEHWIGAYISDRRRSIERALGVALPDLLELAQGAEPPVQQASVCRDTLGRAYSPGARVKEESRTIICSTGGEWINENRD